MGYSLKDFRIHVPRELIAQYPSEERHGSRLLIYDVINDNLSDDYFKNIKKYISPDDCVVYNNARVINARLYGYKTKTGAHLEILLTKRVGDKEWLCLIGPARRVRPGIHISLECGYSLKVLENYGDGSFKAEFSRVVEYEDLKRIGEIPLPKYIKRKPIRNIDDIRYQTVYSEAYGAIASPTAGLHFTAEIVDELRKRGTVFVPVTLYVDWGTFKPVRESDYRNHKIHSESFEITEKSANIINNCIRDKRRVICVGTTSVRTVETLAGEGGMIEPGKGETSLYIYPGYKFRIVQGMITNFHMPDSTLILLVAAFAGKRGIERAYNHAVSKKYRFFSYGDAMFLYNRGERAFQ